MGEAEKTAKGMELTDIANYHLSSSLAFIQVKTTSPESYRVRPSSGVIPASSSAEVSVFLQPGKKTLHVKLRAEKCHSKTVSVMVSSSPPRWTLSALLILTVCRTPATKTCCECSTSRLSSPQRLPLCIPLKIVKN